MAKMLDLNALDQPILEVKLRDEARTIFRLTTPTTKLVERFVTIKDEVSEIVKTKDVEKLEKLYEFTAEIISCNAEYITVTAEELKTKYRLTLGDLVVIFAAYLDFIKELNSAKN
jgi:superfamily II RNA helicase